MGKVGLINYKGVRIAGLSGIFHHRQLCNATHYSRGDVRRLLAIKRPVDIVVTHDWPRGITAYGNQRDLLRVKPFLREEIRVGEFGSPLTPSLLNTLQPRLWIASHMHVFYECLYGRTVFLALNKNSRHPGWVRQVEYL